VSRPLNLLVALAGAVLLLDQWTKRLALEHLQGAAPVPLIDGLLQLTFTRNTGIAFGLGAGTRFPFWIFSLLAVLVIAWLMARGRVAGLWPRVGLSLICGGALGNLIDRVTTGSVVDFIEVGTRRWTFPVFNLADSAVTVGVALFALTYHKVTPPQAATVAPGEPLAGDGPPGASEPPAGAPQG
jgi:signal peptidase II